MLRKMLSLGALVVVAVTFGVSNATAKPPKNPSAGVSHTDGFADGNRATDGFADGN